MIQSLSQILFGCLLINSNSELIWSKQREGITHPIILRSSLVLTRIICKRNCGWLMISDNLFSTLDQTVRTEPARTWNFLVRKPISQLLKLLQWACRNMWVHWVADLWYCSSQSDFISVGFICLIFVFIFIWI